MDKGMINLNVNKAASTDYKSVKKEKNTNCEKFDTIFTQKVDKHNSQMKDKSTKKIQQQDTAKNKKDDTLPTTSIQDNDKTVCTTDKVDQADKTDKKDKVVDTDKIIDNKSKESTKKDMMELLDVLAEMAAFIASKEIKEENSSDLLGNIKEIQLDTAQIISNIDDEATNMMDKIEINNQVNKLISQIQTMLKEYEEEIDPKYAEKLFQLKEVVVADVRAMKNTYVSEKIKQEYEVLEEEHLNVNDFENLESKINKKESKDSSKELVSLDPKKQENNMVFFAHKAQKIEINDQMIQNISNPVMIDQETIHTNSNAIENTIQRTNFQNILEQIVDKGEVILKENASEMTLQLKPDHLGKLSMKIEVERGIVVANIVAENQAVKEVLESNFNALRDSLNAKGFGIEQLNVSIGENSSFEQQQNFMNSKKKNNKRGNERSSYEPAIEEVQNIIRSENTMQIDGLA
ncbi:flagellar hook-length control protein FliK [Anaerophilus nitritogenes]|uniref:flagellar hook-length control protein FliK n=1 Tax=Anaerophilus nitritogenes TaxID=2498136 RepID=UPI00101CE9DE|nr:flagellar hook-length control protein FliK [Anaerophilus nitritogenes]